MYIYIFQTIILFGIHVEFLGGVNTFTFIYCSRVISANKRLLTWPEIKDCSSPTLSFPYVKQKSYGSSMGKGVPLFSWESKGTPPQCHPPPQEIGPY